MGSETSERCEIYQPAYPSGRCLRCYQWKEEHPCDIDPNAFPPSVVRQVTGYFSKAATANPKDLMGVKKVSISKFPMTALIHGAHAMMNGATKYGPFNWRANDVIASIYVDAASRHLIAWFEREEIASDSGVHHLGHALASIAIILDAQENGNLIDDRPNAKNQEVIKNLLGRLAGVIAERSKPTEEK